jgi:hypothetical protein
MKPPQPTPPPPTEKPAVLGPFTTLRGGGGGAALAAGTASSPIVSLHEMSATWWIGDTATSIRFDDAGPVRGSVWIDGGKRLRVGLGTIDVAAKTFTIEPALQSFLRDVKRIGGIAWFPDGSRVALLINGPALRVDQRPPRDYDRSKRELVIVSLAGTEPPVRGAVTVKGTPMIAAGDDRVIVAGNDTQLFDNRAVRIEVAFASLPDFASHVSFNAGRFVHVKGSAITLVEARSGATLATWAVEGIVDAVATGNTIVAVDGQASVHLGCLAGGKVSEVAKASAGSVATLVQVVGDRVVVSADGPEPIRVATLSSPCAP